LFDKAISASPADKKLVLYLMNGDMEEKYGLINHAMEIYDKMITEISYDKKEEAFYMYI